ncbi:hypothetical protein [Lelliottia sp. CFBP8978]|uniref:hypothetical protein n=1 Tax=Lelliottia sp. CFBP8978 TaxID=3096522 RepID=UPI002A6995F4|nr:hypothetical protein [Lelliottia sp. CFBP8978]MDY1039156.1 hypothetical protein [Lelliottia sp. CFBP8978]
MKVNFLSSTVFTGYLLACGTLYLWGFWLNFDLNILQFVDIADIVKATILPMITSLCLMAVNGVSSMINNPQSEASKNLWKEGGSYRFAVYLQYAFLLFVTLSVIYTLGKNFIFGTRVEKYLVAGAILGTVAYFWVLFKTKFLSNLNSARGIVVTFVLGMPLIFMQKGNLDAKEVLNGNNTFIIQSKNLCDKNNENETFRFIGNLSDKGFALSLYNNSLCIFKYENIKLTKEKRIIASNYGIDEKLKTFFNRIWN